MLRTDFRDDFRGLGPITSLPVARADSCRQAADRGSTSLRVTITTMNPTQKVSTLLLIASLLLAGCTTSPGLAMKIEAPPSQSRVLLGNFTGSVALIQGSPKNAEIQASDGALTCIGKSNNGQFSTDMRMNRITHTFALTCSNGTSGQIILNINASAGNVNGIGVGTLSDGSKIKVIVGDLTGTLNW